MHQNFCAPHIIQHVQVRSGFGVCDVNIIQEAGMCLGSERRVMSAQPLPINQLLHETQQDDTEAAQMQQRVSYACI